MASTGSRAPALDGLVLPAGPQPAETARQWRQLGFGLDKPVDGAGCCIAFAGHALKLEAGSTATTPLLIVHARQAAAGPGGAASGLRLAITPTQPRQDGAPAAHVNGAQRLAGLTVATCDPVASAADCARLFGPTLLSGVAGGLHLTLADGFVVRFLSPAAAEQRYDTELAEGAARCVALSFETVSLAHTGAALGPGISWQAGRRLVVAAGLHMPLLLSFEEPASHGSEPSLPTRSHPIPERLH